MHELTSEVNSRVRCVAKVMDMPGIRTAVADLCMFGLAACDEGGPGFVNVSVRTITNARRVGVRLQSKCGSMHRHAQVNADNTIETRERTGPWVRQVAQTMEEQLKEDQQELETREHQRKVEDAERIRRIVHENDKNKGVGHVQDEMGRLMHHDEQELLSVGDGTGMTTKAGGLILTCAPRQDVKKWSTSVATKCTQGSPEKPAYVRRERRPSRHDGRRLTRGNQGSPTCARGGSRRNTRHTKGQSYTRQRHHSRR